MDHTTVYFLTQTRGDLPAVETWLAPGERDRAAGFRFPKRHGDWILGRWTAKQALQSFLVLTGQQMPDYPDLEIRSAPDGAPAPYRQGVALPVALSLSHSD